MIKAGVNETARHLFNQGTRPKMSGEPQSGTRPELRFREVLLGREAEQWIVD